MEEPRAKPSSQEKYTNASSARLSFLRKKKKKQSKKPLKPHQKITLTIICNIHYPDLLKATETNQNSASHDVNWAEMY